MLKKKRNRHIYSLVRQNQELRKNRLAPHCAIFFTRLLYSRQTHGLGRSYSLRVVEVRAGKGDSK